MKKVIVLLSIVLLLMTGCSIKKLDDKDFESNMNVLLSEKVSNSNVNFEGYKYYVPEGLKFVNKEEYTAIFKDRFNNKYYLYVDIISYYEKFTYEYTICEACFYSKKINYDGKYGYVEINLKENNQYLIEIMYNYAKIEVMVDYEDINLVLYNCVTILKDLEYNDMIIEPLVNNKSLNFKEETYDIFNPKSKDSSYLNIIDGGTQDSSIENTKDFDLVN